MPNDRHTTAPRIQLSTVITIVVVLVTATWAVFTLVSSSEQRVDKQIERLERRSAKYIEMVIRHDEIIKQRGK